MAISGNALLIEQVKLVTGLTSVVPSTSVPDYVSLKGYRRCGIIIQAINATTVTGSAISLLQATDVSGTGAKALAFTRAWRNIDTGAADALAEFAVTSNTFTTNSTNSKALLYYIDVEEGQLDVAGGFDCIRAVTGNATAATLTVLYALYPSMYGGVLSPSAIID